MRVFISTICLSVALVHAFDYNHGPHHLPNHKNRPKAPGLPKGNWDYTSNKVCRSSLVVRCTLADKIFPPASVASRRLPQTQAREGSEKPDKHGYCVAYDVHKDKTRTWKCGMVKDGADCERNGDPCYVPAFHMGFYDAFCVEEGHHHADWNRTKRSEVDSRDDGMIDGDLDDDRIDSYVDDDGAEVEGLDEEVLEVSESNMTLFRRGRVHGARARCSLKLKEDPVPPKCEGNYGFSHDRGPKVEMCKKLCGCFG